MSIQPKSEEPADSVEDDIRLVSLTEEDEDSLEVSRKTKQLMDFLNAHYKFRYNTIMGYTEYKDNDYHYMDWMPVDDRTLLHKIGFPVSALKKVVNKAKLFGSFKISSYLCTV